MQRLTPILIAVLAAVALVVGWRAFFFLTDDAYIAFRYIGNSLDGHGYVWNAAPFRPVEGYTSFLWVALLDGIWRLTGTPPSVAANPISLVCAGGTLLVTAAMLARMRVLDDLTRTRNLCLGFVLVGCLTNRTFLAWTSSGLETALFNFLFVAWFYLVAFRTREDSARVWALTCLTAALICLTRPDGLLHVGATALLVLHWIVTRVRARQSEATIYLASTPLLLVPAHFMWRKSFYGEWLPNTYMAKYSSPWPESGLRYAGSFTLEYALWVLFAVLLLALARMATTGSSEKNPPARLNDWLHDTLQSPQRAAAIAVVATHIFYYTFVIGGDHFEYRVYSYLIPLLMLSMIWGLTRLELGTPSALACFVFFLACSWAIPWTHWAETRHLSRRNETLHLTKAVAPNFPSFLRWYAEPFDSMQAWLIDRSVCTRHQEHKVFQQYMARLLPTRDEGRRVDAGKNPVVSVAGVGVVGWVYPQIHVLDELGLNDFVIARNRSNTEHRQMAHDRLAPQDYLDAFRPNVFFTPERRPAIVITHRTSELTDDEIVEIERTWWSRAVLEGAHRREAATGIQ